MKVIDHLFSLPEDQELQFLDWYDNDMDTTIRSNMVKLYTSFDKIARREAMREGTQHGQTVVIRRQLARKFGPAALKSRWVQQKLKQPTEEELELWSDRILDAKTVEEVFG